jgi:uncharacterized membrane protein YccC
VSAVSLRADLSRAAVTLAGVIASFCAMWFACRAVGAQPQPAILAAILAIGLGRRDRTATLAEALLACLRIAGVALAATGVAWLLHAIPPAGAVVFIAGMFLSVWLRDFGERGRTLGALVALPLVAMLVVPVAPTPAPGGPLVDLALAVGAGIVALVFSTAIQWIARSGGIIAAANRSDAFARPERAKRPGITPTMRMALQMAVALALAFAIGFLVFPGHWGWTVLTAFIVCSGARGRGDAAYKAVLRLIGALTGTLAAALLAHAWAPSGVAEAVTIFAILFFGLWLRDVNYAFWACAMTLILAVLAHTSGAFAFGLLALRLEAILIGALCAVVATWFVFPIRTEAIVRLRLAQALVAFDEFVAHAHLPEPERSEKRTAFERRIAHLDEVAPPLRWHRRVFARGRDDNHPARWIELAGSLRERASALEAHGDAPLPQAAKIRRAIGISRRAIADHKKPPSDAVDTVTVGDALERLHATLGAKT